ncbi:MAG: L-aspartate oxidase [Acidobacteriota bacterium]
MPAVTDFLIIGSGIAGLRAAAELADHGSVTVLTKGDPTESNTGYAQGGIAAALGPDDSPEAHLADTMNVSDGLCHEAAARVLVEEGVSYVRELIEWGAAFDRDPRGHLALAREGGHRVRRVLHARDATGREIGRLLWSRVSTQRNVHVLRHARVSALRMRNDACRGADYCVGSETSSIEATRVLLATGGGGQVYSETTNPAIATGDGVALAWRAGARVADLEFVQFHPTALDVPDAPRFLLSEALRGEGAWLLNGDGERFMSRYDAAGELAPRDHVARAIDAEKQHSGRPVVLSMRHLDRDWVHARFPTVAAACRSVGLDLAHDLIPVRPAAHYMMGGVETDLWGRTTRPGLYAAGEAACTGVHGANRLASNSLLEGLVFGARAAEAMRGPPEYGGITGVHVWEEETSDDWGGEDHAASDRVALIDASRALMWRAVGLRRSRDDLANAAVTLRRWHRALTARAAWLGDDASARASSVVTMGWLIARAALRREESRGSHFRTDFPARNDLDWKFHVAECR